MEKENEYTLEKIKRDILALYSSSVYHQLNEHYNRENFFQSYARVETNMYTVIS